MIKIKLKNALFIAFSLAGTLSIIIIILMINFFFDKFFKDYSIKKQEEKNQKVLTLIKSLYNENMKWNTEFIQEIGINELEEGIIIKVVDSFDNPVWDAMQYNSGICQQMISTMTYRMADKYPSLNGGYTTKEYPVDINNRIIGKVVIGYYGPFYYTESEFFFINTLNRLLIIVAICTIFFSIILSYFFSKNLSNTLIKLNETSQKISEGNYEIRVKEKAGISEINDLIESINHLAGSLEKQENLRKQLTQDISHELRTPLTTLQSHIEAMIDGVWKPSRDRFNSLYEETLRLNNLIKDLTSLNYYDSKNLKLNKTNIVIKSLIESILKLYEHQFQEKRIKYSLKGDEVNINADRDKIKQTFVNLISNASKFTDSKGYFNIKIKKKRNDVLIELINSGKEIPEKELENIFERLYRVEKSRNRKTGGNGIGLSIVKQIVEAHNGTVKAESINKENKFIINLPIK